MADLTLGALGVLGVTLQTATTTYEFISNIRGAPRAIRTLASHVNTLRQFLDGFHEVLSKDVIRRRPQNVKFIPLVEDAAEQFKGILKDLDLEVRQYVTYVSGSRIPEWAGWGSRRRVKYAFSKGSILDLETCMLAKLSMFHVMLRPMNL